MLAMKALFLSCMVLVFLQPGEIESEAIPQELTARRFNSLLSTLKHVGQKRSGHKASKPKPEINWDSVDYKQIDLKTKEIMLTPTELYAQIDKCVEECMQKRPSMYRDNCIAKHCDIY